MTAIQDLPDLVIIGILRNAVEEVYEAQDLVSNLPYLAICRQWRHLALTIVYRNMVIIYETESIRGEYKDEDEDEDDEDKDEEKVYKLVSNTSLLANVNCNSMVRRLYIRWWAKSFIEDLHILMNTIAMNETAWPKDISGHLVGDTLNEDFDYNPQKLDSEMYEKMSAIIDNFRDTFPNVKEIGFEIYYSCGVASQFISKLVDVYSNQLTKLDNRSGIPLDLPCFPPNLEYLWYTCQQMSFLPMPKINSLPLKLLELDDAPNDFSWKQCCNSLIFPNLKSLDVASYDDTQIARRDYAHNHGIQLDIPDSQQEQLELPVIRRLCFSPNEASVNKLNIKKIPQHLYDLIYSGNFEGFEHISKLPIDSIDVVDINIKNNVNDIDKFYKVTNRMFGKDIRNNTSTAFQCYDIPSTIDFQKTRWGNITYMCFYYLDSTELVKAIAAIPQLKELTIGFWTYIDEEADWDYVANSKIETLLIRYLEYEGPLKNPANYIVQLLKSLKCLRKPYVPDELKDVLLPKLEEAKKEYQHLQELDILHYDGHGFSQTFNFFH